MNDKELFDLYILPMVDISFNAVQGEHINEEALFRGFSAALGERERQAASAYVCDKHILHDGMSYGCCLWCQCEKYKQQIEQRKISVASELRVELAHEKKLTAAQAELIELQKARLDEGGEAAPHNTPARSRRARRGAA